MTLLTATIDTPIGPLALCARADRLVAVHFTNRTDPRRLHPTLRAEPLTDHPDPAGAASRLRMYFDGDTAAIDQIPTDPRGTTFQRNIWKLLRRIPSGETASYAEIARRAGNAAAGRAVGLANARNPIPLVIPCHRVVASDGTLHGYGGGLDRKRWLLEHEQAHAPLFTTHPT